MSKTRVSKTRLNPARLSPRTAPLAGLIAAHAVSLTGNMITLIALPLYALTELGSAATAGLVGAFATAPVVLGGFFGGALADRIGHRRASVAADVVSGAAIAVVPVLHHADRLPLGALLTLVFVAGVLDTPGQTARTALLPELASRAGVPVERAIGLFEAVERGARLIGAPVAGLLVAGLGALSVLAIDAATFAVSAALVAGFVPGGDATAGRTSQSYWRDLVDGVRFLVRDPLLRAMVLLTMVTNSFDAAKSAVLLPVYADRELGGAAAFGLLVGVMGGGAFAGSLAFSAWGARLPRRAAFVISFLLAGAPPHLAMAAGFPLPALIAVTVLAGFAAGVLNPLMGAVELARIPPGLRARVYGVIGAGCWAVMPVGSLAAGYAVQHAGLTATLAVVGAGYAVVTLTPLLGGPWLSLNRASAPTASQHRTPLT